MKKRLSQDTIQGLAMIAVPLLGVALFVLAPLGWLIGSSFLSYSVK